MPGRWGVYDWEVIEKQRLESGSGRNRVNYLLNLSSLPRISGAHVRTEVLQIKSWAKYSCCARFGNNLHKWLNTFPAPEYIYYFSA
jgi:hypothetical protein